MSIIGARTTDDINAIIVPNGEKILIPISEKRGWIFFKINLQTSSPVKLLDCRLDGNFALQQTHNYLPCNAREVSFPMHLNLQSQTMKLPGIGYEQIGVIDQPIKHVFSITATDINNQRSNQAVWTWTVVQTPPISIDEHN